MGNIGVSELVVILLILMLVFGASRLPALGESFGKAIRTFKRGVAQNDGIEVSHDTERAPKRVVSSTKTPDDESISEAEIVDERKP